jgi:transposase
LPSTHSPKPELALMCPARDIVTKRLPHDLPKNSARPSVLCPTLRKGDVVVMDNLSPHKSELTLSLIEQAGAEVLFLPAYSPDFNPIEQMWSKIKASLRSAQARTQPADSSHRFGFGERHTSRRYQLVCPLWLQFYLIRSKATHLGWSVLWRIHVRARHQ